VRQPYSDAELEAALRDVASRIAYPPERDLLPSVRAAIAEPAQPGFWAGLWSPRLAFVPALATVALLALATLAFQPAGARAAEVLGLRALTVFFAQPTPAPSGSPVPTPSPTGRAIPLDAVRVPDLARASREAGFPVLFPATLGTPDEIYVRPAPQGPQVFLVYGPRSGIPASAYTGIGVLVIEARGGVEQPLIGKFVPQDGRSGAQTVNGNFGVWIEGGHDVFFRAPNGDIVVESLRLAGNVLAWEQDGLFLRIEAEVSREEALRIASSMTEADHD